MPLSARSALILILALAPIAAQSPAITSTPEGTTVLYIEDMRAPTPADARLLVQSAGSATPFVQLAALRAIGRLERRDLVNDLYPYLRHQRENVRLEAAHAIAQSMKGERLALDPNGTQVDGVVQQLMSAATAEKSPTVLAAMAVSIGRLSYERAEQVQRADALLRKIADRSRDLSIGATGAFEAVAGAVDGIEKLARLNARVARISDETIEVLRRIAIDEKEGPREGALRALISARGLDADTLRPNLTVNLKHASEDVRRLAVMALAGAGSPITGDERLQALTLALRDTWYQVRYEALRGYARAHAKADGCGPIMEMLADPSMHVALAAIDALGDSCAGDENAINRLVGEVRTPPNQGNNWQRESHALVALAKVSPPHVPIPMQTHSRHLLWQVRMYAARAAATLNDLPTLEHLAYDANDNVREATIAPLRRLKGDAAEPYFIAALGRPDYQLLRTAALQMEGLAVTKPMVSALVDALQRVTKEKKDTSRDTRVALLQRLATAGGIDQQEQIAPLLKDFDPRVAAEAAVTLQAWTGKTYATDPQPLQRPELPSYAEIAIVTDKRAVLEMESGAEIWIELDPVRAPMMSVRFLRLVNRNHYDNLTFHRVVTNFVLQGGSPGGNEYMGDAQYLRDEISGRTHARGTVGLSTRGRDTGDAQLFINLADNPRLDFDYTIFGHVMPRSLSAIDKIMEGERIRNIKFQYPTGRK